QVDDGADFVGLKTRDLILRAAHVYGHGFGQVARDLQAAWDVAVHDRHAGNRPLDLLAADREPHQRAEAERRELQSEVAKGMPGHHASVSATASALSSFGRLWRIRICSRARKSSGVRRRSMRPWSESEISPRSSEITIATASDSSVRPIAARWRVPRSRSS